MTGHATADLAQLEHPPTSRWVSRVLTVGLCLIAVAAALISGMSVADGDKKMIVLPLAAVVGIGLAALAATRFSWFVLLLIGVRSSIDVLHLSAPTAGTTAGNTAAARGIDPSSLLGVLFLVAALLWLAARYYAGKNVRPTRLAIWLVVFFLTCALSIVGSFHPQASALQTLRIMTAVMMFVVLEQLIRDFATMKRVIVACYASLVVPASYTLLGLATGHAAAEVKSGFTRIIGTFAQSNDYARYLAFLVIFGVAVYPYVKGRTKVALIALVALAGAFLLMTLTLGAILSAVVAVVVIAFIQRRARLLVALLVAGAIAGASVPGLSSRLSATSNQSAVGGGPSGNSLEWRLGYWAEVLPLANANPVTGIGLSSTQYETDQAKQPHNDFLRAYVETGVIGLLAYLAVLLTLATTTWRAIRRTVRGSFAHAVGTGAFACVVCFIIESLAANVITNVVNLWYLVAFAAAASFVARTGGGHDEALEDTGPSGVERSRRAALQSVGASEPASTSRN